MNAMRRDAAIFLVGVWVMGSLFMVLLATQNFLEIDRLLEERPNEAFSDLVNSIGEAQARDFMRYLSSELNRLYFQLWNVTQLILGGVLLLLVYSLKPRHIRWGVMTILAITFIQTSVITPWILSVGRALDFVPRDPVPMELSTFGVLHGTYAVLDLLKIGGTGVVGLWLCRSSEEKGIRSR